jgi:hypothetical protein
VYTLGWLRNYTTIHSKEFFNYQCVADTGYFGVKKKYFAFIEFIHCCGE